MFVGKYVALGAIANSLVSAWEDGFRVKEGRVGKWKEIRSLLTSVSHRIKFTLQQDLPLEFLV